MYAEMLENSSLEKRNCNDPLCIKCEQRWTMTKRNTRTQCQWHTQKILKICYVHYHFLFLCISMCLCFPFLSATCASNGVCFSSRSAVVRIFSRCTFHHYTVRLYEALWSHCMFQNCVLKVKPTFVFRSFAPVIPWPCLIDLLLFNLVAQTKILSTHSSHNSCASAVQVAHHGQRDLKPFR